MVSVIGTPLRLSRQRSGSADHTVSAAAVATPFKYRPPLAAPTLADDSRNDDCIDADSRNAAQVPRQRTRGLDLNDTFSVFVDGSAHASARTRPAGGRARLLLIDRFASVVDLWRFLHHFDWVCEQIGGATLWIIRGEKPPNVLDAAYANGGSLHVPVDANRVRVSFVELALAFCGENIPHGECVTAAVMQRISADELDRYNTTSNILAADSTPSQTPAHGGWDRTYALQLWMTTDDSDSNTSVARYVASLLNVSSRLSFHYESHRSFRAEQSHTPHFGVDRYSIPWAKHRQQTQTTPQPTSNGHGASSQRIVYDRDALRQFALSETSQRVPTLFSSVEWKSIPRRTGFSPSPHYGRRFSWPRIRPDNILTALTEQPTAIDVESSMILPASAAVSMAQRRTNHRMHNAPRSRSVSPSHAAAAIMLPSPPGKPRPLRVDSENDEKTVGENANPPKQAAAVSADDVGRLSTHHTLTEQKPSMHPLLQILAPSQPISSLLPAGRSASEWTQREVELLMGPLNDYYSVAIVDKFRSISDEHQQILHDEGCPLCLQTDSVEDATDTVPQSQSNSPLNGRPLSSRTRGRASAKFSFAKLTSFVVLTCRVLHCTHVMHMSCLTRLHRFLVAHAHTGQLHFALPSLDLSHGTVSFRHQFLAQTHGLHGEHDAVSSHTDAVSGLSTVVLTMPRDRAGSRRCLLEVGVTHIASNAQSLHLSWPLTMSTFTRAHDAVDGIAHEYLIVAINAAVRTADSDALMPAHVLNTVSASAAAGTFNVAPPQLNAEFSRFAIAKGKMHIKITDLTANRAYQHTANFDLTSLNRDGVTANGMTLVLSDEQTHTICTIGIVRASHSSAFQIAFLHYDFMPPLIRPAVAPPLKYNADIDAIELPSSHINVGVPQSYLISPHTYTTFFPLSPTSTVMAAHTQVPSPAQYARQFSMSMTSPHYGPLLPSFLMSPSSHTPHFAFSRQSSANELNTFDGAHNTFPAAQFANFSLIPTAIAPLQVLSQTPPPPQAMPMPQTTQLTSFSPSIPQHSPSPPTINTIQQTQSAPFISAPAHMFANALDFRQQQIHNMQMQQTQSQPQQSVSASSTQQASLHPPYHIVAPLQRSPPPQSSRPLHHSPSPHTFSASQALHVQSPQVSAPPSLPSPQPQPQPQQQPQQQQQHHLPAGMSYVTNANKSPSSEGRSRGRSIDNPSASAAPFITPPRLQVPTPHSPLLSASPQPASPLPHSDSHTNALPSTAPLVSLTPESMVGSVVRLAKTHSGSRYMQQRLEANDAQYVQIFYDEMKEAVAELMIDNFGHFAIEKLIAVCNEQQITELTKRIAPAFASVACQKHGSFSIQALVDQLTSPQQIAILTSACRGNTLSANAHSPTTMAVTTTSPSVHSPTSPVPFVQVDGADADLIRMICHSSGYFVVLRILQRFSAQQTAFIESAITQHCLIVGTDHHGLRVIKALLAARSGNDLAAFFQSVVELTPKLVEHQYGNYVVQSCLDVCPSQYRGMMKLRLVGHFARLSKLKFSSNVVESAIRHSSSAWRSIIISELCEQSVIAEMLRDRYSNYAMQTALNCGNAQQIEQMIAAITPHLNSLRENVKNKWKEILKKAANNTANNSAQQTNARPNSPPSPVRI